MPPEMEVEDTNLVAPEEVLASRESKCNGK